MKKPTQAEEITKLSARVAKLEFDSNNTPFSRLWERVKCYDMQAYQVDNGYQEYQQDMDAMKAMVERFAPLPPEHNNNWAITAMVIAFIALISAISIGGYYKADMDRYAVALNKRILALETAKAPVEVAQTWTAPQQVVPTLEVAVAETCWMRITDADGKIIREGMFSSPWSEARDFVNVRNGCPGKVTYKVNGKEVHPVNKSGKPEQSEVVTLP